MGYRDPHAPPLSAPFRMRERATPRPPQLVVGDHGPLHPHRPENGLWSRLQRIRRSLEEGVGRALLRPPAVSPPVGLSFVCLSPEGLLVCSHRRLWARRVPSASSSLPLSSPTPSACADGWEALRQHRPTQCVRQVNVGNALSCPG